MRARRAAWGVAAVISLLAPAAAHAAPPAPGCLGANFADPAGDATETGSGLDVTGGFLTLRGEKVVVNLRFADLDLETYPQPDDLYKTVRVLYQVGGSQHILQVTFNRKGDRYFSWGNGTNTSRENSGSAHPGRDGVIEMEVPNAKPGQQITVGEIRTESYKAGGVEFRSDENMTRRTMDVAQGTKQTLACPAAPAPKQEPAPAPAPAPQQQPAAVTPAPEQPAQPAPPQAARTVTLRARRLKGGRVRLTGHAAGVPDGTRVVIARGRRVVTRAVVIGGRFKTVTRAGRGAGLRARVAGRTSALVRVR